MVDPQLGSEKYRVVEIGDPCLIRIGSMVLESPKALDLKYRRRPIRGCVYVCEGSAGVRS
jgi:hypothetical protein